jgi:hypothetical protein
VERRGAPLVLFDADRDRSRVVDPGHVPGARTRSEWTAGAAPERTAWLVGVDAFGETARHVAFRAALRNGTRERLAREAEGAATEAVLLLRVRAPAGAAIPLEVALTLTDGSAWGTTVPVAGAEWTTISIPLQDLVRVPLVLIPRPYPTFLPYDLTAGGSAARPDLRLVEAVQLGFARGATTRADSPAHLELESVHLRLPAGR